MTSEDKYYSIADRSEGLFKDRGSRFISYAVPVSGIEQVKPIVDALKKDHHAARHHCYAYRIGHDRAIWRANDDGEPSGSAGRPILGAIDSALLSDVLVVVVRYFGGILLGVPGLINAYRSAAADALERAVKLEKTATRSFVLQFDYSRMNDVQVLVKSTQGIGVVSQKFDLQCEMTLSVPLSQSDSFAARLPDGVALV